MSQGLKIRVVEEHILVVTFHRPPVNSLTYQVYKDLSSIFSETVKDENIRVVVFRAEGKVFCGGQDVNDIVNDSPEDTIQRRAALKQALLDVYGCPIPIICLVNGGAVGAGCIIVSCSDIIIASDQAFFSLPEIDVGIIGGGKHLSRILPMSKVRYMALTAERVSAKEFYRLGAIEKLVKPEQLIGEGMKYARKIASKSPILLRRWKQSFIESEDMSLMDSFSLEQRLTQEISHHHHSKKASESFLKKSKPKY
jgi:enoyl-CoA hydratase